VTGGGSGIGRAAALRLAARGCVVAVLDLDEANGRAAVREIEATTALRASSRPTSPTSRAVERTIAASSRATAGSTPRSTTRHERPAALVDRTSRAIAGSA
jgi:NAD(P)-dependent dehydrogenase (short-subunit alcohol dehydrogenase family)